MRDIEVVGAAIFKDGKVLMARRSDKMNNPLKWEFPGGKVEPGETHSQALEREIREELGVRIKVGPYIAAGTDVQGDKAITLHVYRADLVEGAPVAREHAELIWAEPHKLLQYDWAAADIPACRILTQH